MLLQRELGVIEDSYYEASAARPPPLPPLTGHVDADVCVIGAGLAGLSCALELALRGFSVTVLEAQRVGWGASGRNGGQVLPGFGSEGEHAIEHQLPREDALRAWDVSVAGVDLLKRRIAHYAIECDYAPGALTLAVRRRKMHELDLWARHVRQRYGYSLRRIPPDEIGDWIASTRFVGGYADERAAHLHPLSYCLGLARAAQQEGVRVFEDSPVFVIECGARPCAKTAQGQVHARFLVLAGNVYLAEYGDLAPALSRRIMPVGTYIVATAQMEPERTRALLPHYGAVSDTNFVIDYFRRSGDGRLLFGAGDSYSARKPINLVQRIRRRMLGVFPQLDDIGIEHAWGGFVDITMNRAPNLGRLSPTTYYMQGFSGHGLAFTGMAGLMVAEAITGQASRFDVFSRLTHHAFPGGAWMRTPALVLGMLWFQLRDLL